MRIGTKLSLAFIVMLAFAGVIGLVSIVQLSKVARDADVIETEVLGSVSKLAAIRFNLSVSRSTALETLIHLEINPLSAAASLRAMTAVDTRLKNSVSAYLPLMKTPEQRKAWEDAAAKWDDYRKLQDEAIAVAQNSKTPEAVKLLLGSAKARFAAAVSSISKIIDGANEEAEVARVAANATASNARRMILLLLAAEAAIGCAIGVLMTRAITRPLKDTVGLLRNIGAGELNNAIDTRRPDEFGELLTGLAAAQTQLRERAAAESAHAAEMRRRAEADRLVQEADRERAEADSRAIEEIQQMVAAVIDGHIDRRLTTEGKQGFARQLAESLNTLIESVAGLVQGVSRLVTSASQGDLTSRIRIEGRSGLDVQIGQGVNQLVAEMAAIVAKVKDAAERLSVGAAEISQGNSSLSQRTEDQASSLQETAASMDQMRTTVRQNADNARHANQLAIEAREHAEGGSAVISSAVLAMDGINVASKKIADIIGVIDEIAFQTNLLALNAAVEAARAGEQGRGFAVVASEVRSLASRSAAAAKEIKQLINDSVDRVADGSRVVSDSGATFEQVVVSVKKVSDIIAGIAEASADQASGIEHVGNAVAKMDELTQQNAAMVEEAAAASQTLAEQSNGLRTMMSRYQVRENAVDPDAPIKPVHARRRASDGARDAALDSRQEPEREARRA